MTRTNAGAERLAHDIDLSFEQVVLPSLGEYIEIACLSPAFDPNWAQTGAMHKAAEHLLSWCRGRALREAHFEIVELDGLTPVLFAEIAATDPQRRDSTTLVYGHFDKQPPLGDWRDGLEAFRAVREGDRLYGRGSADDGYATYSAMCALEALTANALQHGRVVILIESSEESGSKDLDSYFAHLAHRIGEPRLVVCLDSGCATYDRLWMTTSLRGVLVGNLRVDVLDDGIHSGMGGGIVPSSFRIARELLSRLENEHTGEIALSELNATIPSHRDHEIAAVADEFGEDVIETFPTVKGLKLRGSGPKERLVEGTWKPALEVIGAEGLPALKDAGNVLRAHTTLKLSIRLPPTCDPTRAARAVASTLLHDPPDGASVSFTVEQSANGWDAPVLAPWLARALDEASPAFFKAPWRAIGFGGTIPFLAALADRFPDAQFLATGVLGPEANAHGPNEFLHIPTFKALTATIAHVLAVAP
jgi:acetylornithine deacetylase/succinyl-diaminopimelate desuccinylase-like protein